jgi:peroxiredoxin
MAPIAIGDKIPDGNLLYIDHLGGVRKLDIYKFGFKKKIVIFGLPGAFTPVCRFCTSPP